MQHLIRQYLVLLFIAGWPLISLAQFNGGSGDGEEFTGLVQARLDGDQPGISPLYLGGSGDGESSQSIAVGLNGQTLLAIYDGGSGDGHTYHTIAGGLGGGNIAGLYSGGSGDGHNFMSFSGGLEGTELLGIYAGGSGDGHDKNGLTASLNGFEVSAIYAGGSGDGHVFDSESLGLNGEDIAGLFGGGPGDGHVYEAENTGLDGQSIVALYGGGSGDGHDKVTGQFVIDIPDCRFVINGQDDGFGSLRYAISCAQPGDTVTFGPGMAGDTVLLTSEMLNLEKSLAISAGDAEITIDAHSVSRAFEVYVGYEVVLSGLHIVVGQDMNAAGIYNEGMLTLIDITIVNPNPSSISIRNNLADQAELRIRGNCVLMDGS